MSDGIPTADRAFVTHALAIDPSLFRPGHSYRLLLDTNLSAAALLSGIRVSYDDVTLTGTIKTPAGSGTGDPGPGTGEPGGSGEPGGTTTTARERRRARGAAADGAARRALRPGTPHDRARACHARGQGHRAASS